MTSTYKVEHDYGTSTIEGVHGISHRDHLVFCTEEGKVFAGFAAGTWHWFKKVEVEVEVEAAPYPVGTWVSSTTFSDTFGPVVKVEGTILTIRPVAGESEGRDYAIGVRQVTDVLTREQVFKLPVGTRVKSTRDLAEFEVMQGGASYVVYGTGGLRHEAYWYHGDLNLMPEYTEFKVIA